MCIKLLVLGLAATAMAEDFTNTPFRWPDMLRNGGRVVQVLTSEANPKPPKDLYPTWYQKYPLRFVEEAPTPPGGDVAQAEVVILEYDITDKMGFGSGSIRQVANAFGFMGQAMMDKMSPKHNQLGVIAKNAKGEELGRYVLSLWPIGNDEIVDINKDLRQRPRVINNTLTVLNRALVSVELSKANSWWGLPSDTKQVHVANLNLKQFKLAMIAVKEYAEKIQYFNDYEITDHTGKILMPAVTCNSMVQFVVNKATQKDVFNDGLAKVGYLALHVDQKKKVKGTVPTRIVRGLMANKKSFNDHYNKDMYIVPAYYDGEGNPRPNMMREDPQEWYVVWTGSVDWRQNYLKADKFQTMYGFKTATTEAWLGSKSFEHASDEDPNQNKKYVANPIVEKKTEKKSEKKNDNKKDKKADKKADLKDKKADKPKMKLKKKKGKAKVSLVNLDGFEMSVDEPVEENVEASVDEPIDENVEADPVDNDSLPPFSGIF